MSEIALTVLLVGHLERQVLLPELVVDLLQVLDVVDGLAQHTRLVHLGRIKTRQRKLHNITLHLSDAFIQSGLLLSKLLIAT